MTLLLHTFLWLSLTTIIVNCESLRGANMIVTTVLETPYTMLRDSESKLTGNDRFEGYIVDLVDAISKMLNFNYVLKLNEANMFGSLNRAGKWNGMIGELIDGRAHVAAAGMTITAERESVVDFTLPFMSSGIGVIYKNYHISERSIFDNFIGLLQPFINYSTNTFLVLTVVFGIILLALRRKYKTIVFRILLGFWLLFLFVFASLFIAQLTSYYVESSTIEGKVEEFKTIEELESQNRVVYGCIAGGSTQAFFRNSTSPTYSKMWSRMSSSDPSPFVSTSEEGIERVLEGGYAFIAESTVIEYATSRHCNLYQIGGLIDSKGFGLAVQQGSSIREALNYAILKLQEQGVLSQLKNKWWKEQRGGGNC